MKVLISGASGLVGSSLQFHLNLANNRVLRLVRSQSKAHEKALFWDPQAGIPDRPELEGLDAVIHLAGEPIIGRWNEKKKQALYQSRVNGTRVLCEKLAGLQRPPRVLIVASAMGYYGSRGDEVLTESSPPGGDFLARLCQDWEKAADPARGRGVRTIHLRFGMVLSKHGGALAKMLPIYRLGLGGPLGSGGQYWSWISSEDAVRAVLLLLEREEASGAFNISTPSPVTNKEFSDTLAAVVKRPAVLRPPASALKLALGEMADVMLFSSIRMHPQRLLETGFDFLYPELHPALLHVVEHR